METFEIEYAGEIYEIEAADQQSALNALAKYIGSQSAEAMVPSPVDFGQAPVERENVFGDVAAQAIKQPLEATKFYAGRVTEPDRTMLQRAGDVAMTGLAGLSTAYAAGAGTLAEMIAGDTTQERKLARDLMMMGEVAVPELAGVTSGATRLGRQVAVGKTPIARREIGEMTPTMEAARAAEDIGVLPTAGMQGRGAAMMEAGFETSPFSTGQIIAGRERAIGEMTEAAKRASERVGMPTSMEMAGEALQSGAKKFASDFTKKSELLYKQVDNYIRPDDLIVAPNTAQALQEIVQFAADNPEIAREIGVSRYQSILKGLSEGGIETAVPYQMVKDLRSTFGEAIGNMTGPLADMSQAKIKRIYGALSQDMEAAAQASGPEAYKAWKRANDYYRAGATRIEDNLARITDAATSQDAYNRLQSILIEGNARQSTNQLMQIRKSLPKDDFDTFRSTLISNLGRAKAGAQSAEGDVFSPNVFLTNYNRINPSARKIVFGEADAELQKLAKTVEMAKDAAAQLNTSRTAPALSTQAMIAGAGSLIVSPATVVGLYVANKGGAAILTNKTFLKALNAAAKNDMGPLQRLAGGEGFIAAEASTILRTLAAQEANQ